MTEDTSWVFDSLVCFLHGPVWNAPLQTFIEEKSLIFDPNEKADLNNPEFIRIHEEYKNLVDFMLGSFMDELQITPYQFEVACLEGRQSGSTNEFSFHQGLFQQIWAANDIHIFVRMMTQRNLEIQLQALDLIEHRQSAIVLNDSSADVPPEVLPSNSPNGAIDAAADDGADTVEEVSQEKEMFESIEAVLKREQDEHTLIGATANADESTSLDDTNEKFKRLNLFFAQEKVNSADVQSRQEYLRAQRDKILDVKKKARAHQLSESVKRYGRPTSAQAAQSLLAVDGAMLVAHAEPHEASLQLRKTLARRLRTEVVNEKRNE